MRQHLLDPAKKLPWHMRTHDIPYWKGQLMTVRDRVRPKAEHPRRLLLRAAQQYPQCMQVRITPINQKLNQQI